MKTLVCQLCAVNIYESDLFDHLVNKHKWQTNSVTQRDMEQKKDAEPLTKKSPKKKKGSWQKSPELLTCPYCKQIFKHKQILLEHTTKCPHKHITNPKLGNVNPVSVQNFSYVWACNQQLDPRYEKTVATLTSDKTVDYLTKEIHSLLISLRTDPTNELIVGRLIIYSKAKQRIISRENKAKRDQKNKGFRGKSKTDALDHRLPGSYGTGRR